jgi:hypothetical protein
MYYTAVEMDLGCIGDIGKYLEGFVKLIVVVKAQRLDPRLDFLRIWLEWGSGDGVYGS